MQALGGDADRVEQRPSGLKAAASFSYPGECSGAGNDEDEGEGPARLSVALETTADEAALILSGKLVHDALVAFEIVLEQLALSALPSLRVDVRGLTAVDWRGLCSLTALGRWAQVQGIALRVEAGNLSACSDLGVVLSVALGGVSPSVRR